MNRESDHLAKTGLKIKRQFTKEGNIVVDSFKWTNVDMGSRSFEIPLDWTETDSTQIQALLFEGDPDNTINPETSLKSAVSRVVNTLRWWGESYGYFNRKTDGLAFADEIAYLLLTQSIALPPSLWQGLGIRYAYNVKGQSSTDIFFVDPETGLVHTTTESYSYPLLISETTEYIDGALDISKFLLEGNELGWENFVHALRLLVIAEDISILASGFRSTDRATEIYQQRPLNIRLNNVTDNINVLAYYLLSLETQATSAELAQISSMSGIKRFAVKLASIPGTVPPSLAEYADDSAKFLRSRELYHSRLFDWGEMPPQLQPGQQKLTPTAPVVAVKPKVKQPAIPAVPPAPKVESKQDLIKTEEPKTSIQTTTMLNSRTLKFNWDRATIFVIFLHLPDASKEVVIRYPAQNPLYLFWELLEDVLTLYVEGKISKSDTTRLLSQPHFETEPELLLIVSKLIEEL